MKRLGRRASGCVALTLFTGISLAQGLGAHATSAAKQAATITFAEVEKALGATPKTGIKDAALRVIPMGADYNVGVFAIRRSLINGKPIPDAYQHHDVSEIYQVVSGGGTLVTGGVLEQPTEMQKNDPSVVRLMGPTAQGIAISGGTSQRIGPGDIVMIPANTPHGFTELGPDGISYVLVRIDPHHVLPTK
jgi:mannose-6-phosphate isomerase-like protein (cupin superfamily)